MITKYVIRNDTHGNERPSSFYNWDTAYPIKTYHDTELSALKEIKKIENSIKDTKINYSITKTTYANENNIKRDFRITTSYVWTSWFHGYDMLNAMIKANE